MSEELDWRTRRDMDTAARTGALAELGFGPAYLVAQAGGFIGMLGGGLQAANCLTCGAMVVLTTTEVPVTERPLYVHWTWHQETDGGDRS